MTQGGNAMNTIGIDHNLDRPRIRKLLLIGLFASILTGVGDFLLGYADSTAGGSGAEVCPPLPGRNLRLYLAGSGWLPPERGYPEPGLSLSAPGRCCACGKGGEPAVFRLQPADIPAAGALLAADDARPVQSVFQRADALSETGQMVLRADRCGPGAGALCDDRS